MCLFFIILAYGLRVVVFIDTTCVSVFIILAYNYYLLVMKKIEEWRPVRSWRQAHKAKVLVKGNHASPYWLMEITLGNGP